MTTVRSTRPIETDVVAECVNCEWELLSHEAAGSTIKEAARWHCARNRHYVRISRTTIREMRPVG